MKDTPTHPLTQRARGFKRRESVLKKVSEEKLRRINCWGEGGSEWALCDQKAYLFSWRLNSSTCLRCLTHSLIASACWRPSNCSKSQRTWPNQNKHPKRGKCWFKQWDIFWFIYQAHIYATVEIEIDFKWVGFFWIFLLDSVKEQFTLQ